MLSILLTFSQGLLRKILVLCLVTLLSLSGTLILVASPAYAATEAELELIPPEYQPSNDEKIERAYDLSPAAGRLEEMKQQTTNPDQYFDPTKKANMGTIQKSEKSDPGLIEKAKQLVEKVTQ